MNISLFNSIKKIIEERSLIGRESVIAVDADGTLWSQEPIGSKEEPTPCMNIIRSINAIYDEYSSAIIVVYTARRIQDLWEIECLLKKFGVKYHSVQFGKMRFEVLVDDKCINPYPL